MIKLEIIQMQPLDMIAMTPSGTIGLSCVHIAQLMTHQATYTIPINLQSCYKPLVILQRVTKSHKAHILSYDVFKKLHNTVFVDIGLKAFSEMSYRNRNFLLSH